MLDSIRHLDSSALVDVVESTHRQESILVARRMAAVAALLRQRVAAAERAVQQREYAVIDGFDQTTAEVAAAMNLSPAGASYLVSYAEALDTRLPEVAALLAEGRTDWRTVRLVIGRTDLITDDELIAQLDQSLAARIGAWHGWSRQRIVNAVDAAVRAADPDAARERREAAEDDRSIAITPLGNGMAEVYGNVAAATATAFDRRLSELAKQVCPADPRTLDQRRADALAALTQGRGLACACGQPDCPTRAEVDATAGDPGGARVVINVVASEQTVYGDSDAPGYLEGYGVIDAEQVRRLADAASVLIANPLTSPVEALRYQPSAALERAVRCRDLTCRFPGCSRPAVVCDVDHTIPFNHDDPAAGGLTWLKTSNAFAGNIIGSKLSAGGAIRNWATPPSSGLRPPGGLIGPHRPGRIFSRSSRAGRRACCQLPTSGAARSNEPLELLRRASTTASNALSTKPGAGWSKPESKRSTPVSSETTCAACCFCSRAHRVPAPSAPG